MGAIAAIGGALIQGSAAKKAAASQERMAAKDIAFQTETRDIIRNDLSPYRTGGATAQQALDFELGLGNRPMIGGMAASIETIPGTPAQGGASQSRFGGGDKGWNRGILGGGGHANGGGSGGTPTQYRVNGKTFYSLQDAQAYANANMTGGTEYGGYTKTPGYDFRLNQGQDSLQAGAAARGGLYSGAAMRDLMKFGQDYGSNEYGNYLSRLGARADTGMAAATTTGQSAQQTAGNVSNSYGNIGNAQAAGAMGSANALTGGMQNLAGLWNYQKNVNAAGGGQTGGNNWLGGLF